MIFRMIYDTTTDSIFGVSSLKTIKRTTFTYIKHFVLKYEDNNFHRLCEPKHFLQTLPKTPAIHQI